MNVRKLLTLTPIVKIKTKNLLSVLFVSASLLIIGRASVHADTTLTQWAITATTGATNSGVANFVSGFTATELVSGPNLYTGSATSPANTWNRTYTNSPNPIPTHGLLQAISIGDYIGFSTVIGAGWNINVDGVSNLILGKTASAATNAGLYYSIDNGTSWLQAGGTVTLPLSTGTNDYSPSINTGMATNMYQTNGGVWTNGPSTTNSGLATSFIDFDNSSSTSPLTVDWALAFSGAGNGRIGIGNGGNLLTLSGNIVSVPEPSTYALLGLGALALLIAARRRTA